MALPAGIFPNNSSPLPNQVVGLKLSQPGYSATNASDTQLIFNSSWPSVASAFTKLVPKGSAGIVAHNLGYPPFTRAFPMDDNGGFLPFIASTQDAFRIYPNVDAENVYLSNGPTTVAYMIDCSNIDLSTDVDYPVLPSVGVNTAYDPNFGIKISKDNKSVQSKDPRDFVLHSRYRSPLIQAVKTEKTMPSGNIRNGGAPNNTGGIVAYVNSAGKATWVYGFIKVGPTLASTINPVDSYHYCPYFSQAYPTTRTDGISTYTEYLFGDTGATIVVLRDPFFAPTIKQAFY